MVFGWDRFKNFSRLGRFALVTTSFLGWVSIHKIHRGTEMDFIVTKLYPFGTFLSGQDSLGSLHWLQEVVIAERRK